MGLHNLESESLTEIFDQFASEAERSLAHDWLDRILSSYGSIPNAPLSTEAELAQHMLNGLRGLYFHYFHRATENKASLLHAVIQQNSSQRLAIFIEYVECASIEEALERFTVWKGTLWETTIDGTVVVCWHPDKDFRPVAGEKIKRTGYSELGRRKRRRMTRKD